MHESPLPGTLLWTGHLVTLQPQPVAAVRGIASCCEGAGVLTEKGFPRSYCLPIFYFIATWRLRKSHPHQRLYFWQVRMSYLLVAKLRERSGALVGTTASLESPGSVHTERLHHTAFGNQHSALWAGQSILTRNR